MGRAQRKAVDVLRTLVWLEHLKAISGLPTGYAIGRYIHKGDQQPRIWMNYDCAKSVPLNGSRPSAAVANAEKFWPDSFLRFVSPIWKVLGGERLTRRELDRGLLLLSAKARATFFEEREGRWYRKIFQVSDSSKVWELRSFEGIVAAVLLMEEAELAHSSVLRQTAFELYEMLRPYVIGQPDMARVFPYLFTAIDSAMPRWQMWGVNGRTEVHSCWRSDSWAEKWDQSKLEFPSLLKELANEPLAV